MTDRMRIFSNGTQFADWQASNCERCKKWAGWDKEPTCEIDIALGEAYFDDGTVSQEIATRAGYDADRYGWRCGEVEWTEEWIAERKEQMRKPKFEFNENSLISDYLELARRLIPSVQDDNALLYLLWNETSYPSGAFPEIVRQLEAVQEKLERLGKLSKVGIFYSLKDKQ